MAWDAADISIREQVLRSVTALLGSEGTPAATVTRSKLDQVEASDLPCYDVTPDPEKDGSEFSDHEAWPRVLGVKVRAIVDATDLGDGALDPFYLFAVRQLMADHTLDGLANDISWSGADTVFRPEGRDMIGLEMAFEVTFSVKRGDPAQKG